MKPLHFVLGLAVVGIVVSACDPLPSKSAVATPPPTANAKKASTVWSYNEYRDSMTGTSGKYATTMSSNTANLEFPYQGAQQAKLTVADGDIVHISVEKGQITCHNDCKILVKFDSDKTALEYKWKNGDDKSNRIISWDELLIKRIYKSKHMIVRVGFFQNDPVDFEFDIEGLKSFEKAPKTSKKKST
jgi:hypothetical protein